MSRLYSKKTPWSLQSRTQRKRNLIRLQNQIRSHALELGGLFMTHDVIHNNSWADIYFSSNSHRLRFYNATVDTALYAYASACENLAWANSEKLLPLHEQPLDSITDLFHPQPVNGLYLLNAPKSIRVDREKQAFGGLSLYEWISQETKRIADTGDVWVSPTVRLDFSYCFGVGMMSIVPENELTITSLNAFIEDFHLRGENSYTVDRIKLSFSSSQICGTQSSNAINLDPKTWVTSAQKLSLSQIALARAEYDFLSSTILPVGTSNKSHSL